MKIPRFLPKWTIRTRIGLAVFAVATAALVVMALAVFFSFRRTLLDNFDDALRLRATANLSLVETSGAQPRLRVPPSASGASSEDADFVHLYDPGGDLLAAAPSSTPPAAGERGLVTQARRGLAALATVTTNEGRFRAVALPVSQDGAVVGVLITGAPRDSVAETLDILQAILLVVVPLTSGVLAVAAFVIARRALRPVHDITATANAIAAGDLRQRIAGVASQDEVGELATTFNTMIERLAETIERERRFTGDASHELRTPLTAMDAALAVTLSQQRTAEEYRATLAALRSQTARMIRMARQLLLLSRLDADAVSPEFVPVVLPELVEAVLDAFAEQHPEVALTSHPAPPNIIMDGDPEMLARAFTNVLDNAVTHGGPRVRIAVETTLLADTRVALAFSDNGPGIPADLLPNVFHRFRRGDASHSGGAGLGLAIVASIVRLHRGTVTVPDTPAGTTVRFEFPLRLGR